MILLGLVIISSCIGGYVAVWKDAEKEGRMEGWKLGAGLNSNV